VEPADVGQSNIHQHQIGLLVTSEIDRTAPLVRSGLPAGGKQIRTIGPALTNGSAWCRLTGMTSWPPVLSSDLFARRRWLRAPSRRALRSRRGRLFESALTLPDKS
jgi:hypothetical protein